VAPLRGCERRYTARERLSGVAPGFSAAPAYLGAMRTGQRGLDQSPGDLYFDPAVPADERMVINCGTWSVEATHVWNGSSWSRLGRTPVRLVPCAMPVPMQRSA